MECEPFLSSFRESWLGYQAALWSVSAAIRGVHSAGIPTHFTRWLATTTHGTLSWATATPDPAWAVLTTPVAAADNPSPRDRPTPRQLSLPATESCSNAGPVGSHRVPRALCQTWRRCVKVAPPARPPRMETDRLPSGNWLYSLIPNKTTWEI